MNADAISNIGQLIQLSVAPVFLLVAIGSFLNVVTQRLGRAVDRARKLEEAIRAGEPEDLRTIHTAELFALDQRMTYSHWAINFCAMAALLVSIDVALLFLGYVTNTDLIIPVVTIFMLSTLGITLGLGFFLAEIAVATRTVRVRAEYIKRR